ncbi:MAG: VWA domain-containing protein [Terriglobia bacterium]
MEDYILYPSRFSFMRPHRPIQLVAVLVLLFGIRSILAESKPGVITLYVSVEDAQGKPVESLTAEDFELLENNKPQHISSLRFEKGTPVSLGVLLDISKNMAGERINFSLNWIKSLAEKLKSPDEFFISGFSEETQELTDFVSPEDYLEEPVDHIGTGGHPVTGLALDLAMIKVRQGRNAKKALLFLSAGFDVAGPATLDHIAKNGYPIYSLAVAVEGGEGLKGSIDWLKSLSLRGPAIKVYADQSGGFLLPLNSSSEGEADLTKIVYALKNQYRLEYSSSENKKAGDIVKIQIKTKDPNNQVRFLKRYQIKH